MRPANEINVGEAVRATETDLILVECFDAASNQRAGSAATANCKVFWASHGQLSCWTATPG